MKMMDAVGQRCVQESVAENLRLKRLTDGVGDVWDATKKVGLQGPSPQESQAGKER